MLRLPRGSTHQPETYCVGQSTVRDYDRSSSRDTKIPKSSIEWYTKGNVKGALHICALLLRVDSR